MIEVMKDRRGNEIKEGVRVAYNLSGEVALGIVERIRPGVLKTGHSYSWNVWDQKPLIFVRPDSEWSRIASAKGVSKIEVSDSPERAVGKVLVIDA